MPTRPTCSTVLLLLLSTLILAGCGDDGPTAPATEDELTALFTEDEAVLTGDASAWNLRLVGVTFAANSATMTEDPEAVLDKFAQVFALFPAADYSVEGHTDSRGSQAYNLTLSEHRAEAVVEYLQARFEPRPGSIVAVGHGETQPIASNSTAEGRFMNRRIEVIIRR